VDRQKRIGIPQLSKPKKRNKKAPGPRPEAGKIRLGDRISSERGLGAPVKFTGKPET
jgi:hypothetical protein